MFTVSDVRRPFLLWVAVELKAEADMSLTAQRLRAGNWFPRRFVLETRILEVKAGEIYVIRARKEDRFWTGERVPLDRVSNRRPLSRKWRTISSA